MRDPEFGAGFRIGDTNTPKRYSFKMMIELDERFSEVKFRFLFIKGAKGDTSTVDTLLNGQSGNQLMDIISSEHYSILQQKPLFGHSKWMDVDQAPTYVDWALTEVNQGRNPVHFSKFVLFE